ncbi:putative Band 7 domain-containing protein [Helianthus anomalus]
MISMICLLGLELKHSYLLALLYLHGNICRAQVPRMTLDELFEQKNEVAKTVLEELEKVMVEYGCTIKHILMVDIILDPSVRGAMNEINAGNCLFCLSGQQLLCFQTSRGYII